MRSGPGFLTLRKRLVIVFLLGILVPFSLTVLVSYFTIASIQENQIRSQIRSSLAEVQINIENAIDNLNHVSQQLALGGHIGTLLDDYLSSEGAYQRSSLREQIKTEMSLVSYSNPNVGLTMYIFEPDHNRDFETFPSLPFNPDKLPRLVRRYLITYFGPHKSLQLFSDRIVLSALRTADIPGHDGISVYLETSFKLAERILESPARPIVHYLFLDEDRKVAYSQLPAAFPNGEALGAVTSPNNQGFIWSEAVSHQGWTLVSLVAGSDFNRERNSWFGAMGLLFLLFAAVAALLGSLLWEMVYKPLGVFEKEMDTIERREGEGSVVPLKIPEFDRLLFRFQAMKARVHNLLEEVEVKERHRSDLEIEKLIYQINPHFLLNALNTVHWLAVTHQQPEIDAFALSLTRLLHYNLSKPGHLGTVREEIVALQDYVAMQKVRFDLTFVPSILVNDHWLDTPLPRFTLQPLVENSIYHGLGDDGFIGLELSEAEGSLRVVIEDHGPGIDPSPSREGPEEDRRLGMGIGLSYVKRILDHHFEGKATICIRSEPGRGTRVEIRLPPCEV